MKQLVLVACGMLLLTACTAQEKIEENKIVWLSFEEAVALGEKAPKKLLIDVYTDWCGWCKRMDKTTFADSLVIKEINEHFYPVKLDAESKDTVRFRDQVFVYKPEYKANEIALSLLNGKMSYPSYVFLDETFNMISPVAGYKTPEQMMPLLDYFSDNIYKKKEWEQYLSEIGSVK